MMKKILVHGCCGPCAIMPLRRLKEEGVEMRGVFVNPNIHPFTEWDKRRDAFEQVSAIEEIKTLPHVDYDVSGWLREIAFREGQRCRICYHMRLKEVAQKAKRGKFDGFTSTLLYSKFQRHELIRELGQAVATEVGIPFFYRDWRDDWSEGVKSSKEQGIYRQSYCGCIYSEQERYENSTKQKKGSE